MPLQNILLALLKDLPENQLQQVLDFVLFLREQHFSHQKATERYSFWLEKELDKKTSHEIQHLEQEFENYETLYPHESC